MSGDGSYKVVELTTVTDEALESTLNEYTQAGYQLEGIHFAMRESSKRPAMAFLVFTSKALRSEGEGAEAADPSPK